MNLSDSLAVAYIHASAGISTAKPKGGQSADKELDLAGKWDEFWKAVSSDTGIGQITKVMAAIGVVLILFGFIKWAWDRRRGGGGMGNSGGVVGSVLVGGLLCAPDVLLPFLLTIVDILVNALMGVFTSTTGA